MLDSINSDFKLEHEICKSLGEAESKGEDKVGYDYHILVSKKSNKIVLIWHFPYTNCDFCEKEKYTTEPFIWVS